MAVEQRVALVRVLVAEGAAEVVFGTSGQRPAHTLVADLLAVAVETVVAVVVRVARDAAVGRGRVGAVGHRRVGENAVGRGHRRVGGSAVGRPVRRRVGGEARVGLHAAILRDHHLAVFTPTARMERDHDVDDAARIDRRGLLAAADHGAVRVQRASAERQLARLAVRSV